MLTTWACKKEQRRTWACLVGGGPQWATILELEAGWPADAPVLLCPLFGREEDGRRCFTLLCPLFGRRISGTCTFPITALFQVPHPHLFLRTIASKLMAQIRAIFCMSTCAPATGKVGYQQTSAVWTIPSLIMPLPH